MVVVRSILILDMSYTLQMFRERQLWQALDSRKLEGYFDHVVSVHPLAGLFESGDRRFGEPVVTTLDAAHVFVEGTIGISRALRFVPPLNLLLAQIALVRLLRRMASAASVDVVRVGDPYYLGLVGWVLSRLLRVPLAIRVSSNYDAMHRITGKAAFPRLFRFRLIEKAIERFVFPRCALVAGANQDNLEYALANGARQRAIAVVFRYGNLIHPQHFTEPASRSAGKAMLRAIGVEREFLITISRLEAMKQPDHNLFVLKKLRDAGHDVGFVFVGDGSLRGRLEDLVMEMGLSGHVWFAGNRPQDWVAAVLPQARLVLSPQMGRALTEACLAGVPVVAYDLDWQAEVIRSGDTGELVQAGDWEEMARRAARLLADPDHARRLGRNARRAALELMDPRRVVAMETSAYDALFRETERKSA